MDASFYNYSVGVGMIDRITAEDIENLSAKLEKNKIQGKAFLITGGAGFIGSWLCDILSKCDAEVTCVDNLSTGKSENIDHLKKPNFNFINKDISFFRGNKKRYDYIIHLASRVSPEDYQKYPIETLQANSLGTYNILELARKHDATLLFTSTSEVYGDALVVPTPENYWGNVNPVGPRSCYDEGKRFSEALFMAFHKQYGLDVRIARIFNTYGPRIRADGYYARALPKFTTQALENRPITVYGDGSQTRSFCYVTDTLYGLLLLIFNVKAKGSIVNIGNPKETTILELAKKIKELIKSKSTITFHPLPEDDPKRRCPNINKAKKLLQWVPATSLNHGLEKVILWFQRKS